LAGGGRVSLSLIEGEELLRELDKIIESLERAREAASKVNNQVLYREVSSWLPPSLKVRGWFSQVLDLLNNNSFVTAKTHACSLSRYLGRLRVAMETSGYAFVTYSLGSVFARVYGFVDRICREEFSY
jgi:hypothetical protein